MTALRQPDKTAPVITIDGPSGSGKGTISQLVAQKLKFNFLDSGALYRLTALAARKRNTDWADEDAVAKIAEELQVQFETGGEKTVILLDGDDATDAIRKEEMSLGSSKVAAHPKVRAALLNLQKSFQQGPGLVADGRDMGTTVFPDASVKIFLTASAEERAQRRYKQLMEKGESVSLRALLTDIQARDERDSQRAVSPLKPADDALILDSTTLSIVEVLDRVLDYAAQKGITPAG
ncbi:(d)CMP kinase [Proteobacteria bacterium 005FR1]|nr:(d)CMP kinase [Proteobacteria bacterium 005FR1]